MAKIYGVVSTKGGVCKTSLTANTGSILADMGKRVLLIDGDFQPTLSSYFKTAYQASYGLTRFIKSADPKDCISKTNINNLDIVISDDPNQKLVDWIKESANNIYYLAASIKKLNDQYDYILIDSQGARGILQQSIILASDSLISPIIPEVIELKEFVRGTIKMLEDMAPPPGITVPMPDIPPLYGLIYRQDRTANSIAIAEGIREKFYQDTQGEISILNTFVPHNVAYRKASGMKMPAHRFETYRPGPTASALETMTALIHELLPHLSDTKPSWIASNGKVIGADTNKQTGMVA